MGSSAERTRAARILEFTVEPEDLRLRRLAAEGPPGPSAIMFGGVSWVLSLLWSLVTTVFATTIELAETFSRLYPWALTTAFGILVLFVLPVLIWTGAKGEASACVSTPACEAITVAACSTLCFF